MAITRLSGGNTPPDGSDPRTFPAIWNDAVDDIEALELPITAARIADGAVTAPKLANTAGAVMVFDDATARTTAIPTPVEGMVTYLKDTDEVDKFDGSAFVPVGIAPAILQVVSTTKTDVFTATSATFTNVTGLAATITPSSASSKILIQVSVLFSIDADAVGQSVMFRLTGGNSSTFVGDAAGSRTRGIFGHREWSGGSITPRNGAITVLDSPATSSAVTYQVQTVAPSSKPILVNRADSEVDGAESLRGISTITLMEVAG